MFAGSTVNYSLPAMNDFNAAEGDTILIREYQNDNFLTPYKPAPTHLTFDYPTKTFIFTPPLILGMESHKIEVRLIDGVTGGTSIYTFDYDIDNQ